jgi:hypothetical protein
MIHRGNVPFQAPVSESAMSAVVDESVYAALADSRSVFDSTRA